MTPGISTQQTAATQPSASNTSQTKQNAPALTSDFETFLKMLTAQAQNQDPLEPLDSSEYASQLAQFSMVEQQVRTNDTLAQLVTAMGGPSISRLAGWIGSEIRAVAPAHFSGAPISVTATPKQGADSATLVIRNSDGTEIDRRNLALKSQTIDWDGLQDDGTKFPDGLYSFSVESFQNGKLIDDASAQTYNRVTEAQIQGDDVVLILDGGQAILADKVTSVRAGGS